MYKPFTRDGPVYNIIICLVSPLERVCASRGHGKKKKKKFVKKKKNSFILLVSILYTIIPIDERHLYEGPSFLPLTPIIRIIYHGPLGTLSSDFYCYCYFEIGCLRFIIGTNNNNILCIILCMGTV